VSGVRPPKLSDVAVRAGVSSATASRVLNGSDRAVGEPYRSKVLAAAAELGYTANTHAQGPDPRVRIRRVDHARPTTPVA
jgi:LacI family transcriptional regulator